MSSTGSNRTFALIGAAGYIAERHMKAIKNNGGVLEAALDITDSVGKLDNYFPAARFFTEFELFDTYVQSLRRQDRKVDFVTICSPNYLHAAHVAFALRSDADAICEKPLVLEPEDIDDIAVLEKSTGRRVSTILQLRLTQPIIELRERVQNGDPRRVHDVDLTYVTARGHWYYASWKGHDGKSGGIATNIGVHFYDMLSFVFGAPRGNAVHHRAADCAAGYLEYDKARVRWFLSINGRDLPAQIRVGQRAYRSITIDGEEIDFTDGLADLHAECYRDIMAGGGFGVDAARTAIETVAHIRRAPIMPHEGERHPHLDRVLGDTGRYANGIPV